MIKIWVDDIREIPEDYTALNKKVQDCCLRRSAIEKFLLSGEHYKLWLEKHGEI